MSKRSLTEGEIALAQSIYRDSIDYARVRVFDRGYAFLNAMGDMSYRGNIYLPHRHHHDFSSASLPKQRLFNHEMMHVWQVQNNVMDLLIAAALEVVKHPFNYSKAYLFLLEPGKDLLDYRFEQQAAIIDEYFLRKHGGTSMNRCLNKGDDTQVLLEAVLNNFLENPSYPRHERFPIPLLR
jgi:hypothetical protein